MRLRIAHGPAGARPLSFYRRGAFRQLGHPPVVIVAARDRAARRIGDRVEPPGPVITVPDRQHDAAGGGLLHLRRPAMLVIGPGRRARHIGQRR